MYILIKKLLWNKNYFFLKSFILLYLINIDSVPKIFSFKEFILLFLLICFTIKGIIFFFKKFLVFNILEISLFILFLYIILNFIVNYQIQDKNQIFRDLIGFVFIFFPYLLLQSIDKKKVIFENIIKLICIGSLISIFIIFIKNEFYANQFFFFHITSAHPYNDPLILFGISYLFLRSFIKLKKNFTKEILSFILILSLLIFFVIFCSSASNKLPLIQLIFISIIILLNILFNIRMLKKKIYKYSYSILSIILTSLIIFIFYSLDSFIARIIEIKETTNYLSANFKNIFFGLGLGSQYSFEFFDRPVGFVHNFLLYIILKLGLLGMLLILFYCLNLYNFSKLNFLKFYKILELKKNNLIFMSSFLIIISGIFYYTFYKFLSYWLIVSLIFLNEKNVQINKYN